jgi:hypothetical protein
LGGWLEGRVVALAKKTFRALREYPTLRDEAAKDGHPIFV